jgi:hypothetical protein
MSANEEQQTDQAESAKVLKRLLELGILTEVRPPLTQRTRREEREPIPIQGKPVSEEILEDRR